MEVSLIQSVYYLRRTSLIILLQIFACFLYLDLSRHKRISILSMDLKGGGVVVRSEAGDIAGKVKNGLISKGKFNV